MTCIGIQLLLYVISLLFLLFVCFFVCFKEQSEFWSPTQLIGQIKSWSSPQGGKKKINLSSSEIWKERLFFKYLGILGHLETKDPIESNPIEIKRK